MWLSDKSVVSIYAVQWYCKKKTKQQPRGLNWAPTRAKVWLVPHLVAIPSWLPLCGRLVVQCASWTRRCALGAPPLCSSQSTLRPPSTSISTSASAETAPPEEEEEERTTQSVIVTEARRSQPDPPQPGDRRLGPIRPSGGASRSSRQPRRAAPFRAGSVRSFFPTGEQFIPWNLDELLESCEQVREESWGSGSASSLRPGKTRLRQSCGR